VYKVVLTESFNRWLRGLRDAQTRRRLVLRLRKVSLGQHSDVKPVAQWVYEMREFFDPGWRMYYARRGDVLIVMPNTSARLSTMRTQDCLLKLSEMSLVRGG
jgi:putative addiction module killer protein